MSCGGKTHDVASPRVGYPAQQAHPLRGYVALGHEQTRLLDNACIRYRTLLVVPLGARHGHGDPDGAVNNMYLLLAQTRPCSWTAREAREDACADDQNFTLERGIGVAEDVAVQLPEAFMHGAGPVHNVFSRRVA